ncbi:MAG TPA: response regulator [Terriglobales bacterium]
MARRILLADDSVTAQNMGRRILSDAGYEVITVNNGSAALKKVAEQAPDLIVLDVYMPGYGGLEVCQRLKEVAETARIPILLSVGKLEPFKPEEARRVRADAFIVKPFEATELLAALTKLEDKIVPLADAQRTAKGRPAGMADPGEDTGWKNRLSIPPGKKGRSPEGLEADDFGQHAPGDSAKKQSPEIVPAVAKVAEEIVAAKSAAEEKPSSVRTEEVAAPAKAEVPLGETSQEPAKETVKQEAAESKAVETASANPAESKAAQTVDAEKTAIPGPVLVSSSVDRVATSDVVAVPVAVAPIAVADQPAPSYSGPRWVAAEIAATADDVTTALDHEMEKSLAANAAFDAGHKAAIESANLESANKETRATEFTANIPAVTEAAASPAIPSAEDKTTETKIVEMKAPEAESAPKPTEEKTSGSVVSTDAPLVASSAVSSEISQSDGTRSVEPQTTEAVAQSKQEAYAAAASMGSAAEAAVIDARSAADNTSSANDAGNKQQLAAAWEQWQNVRETVLSSPVTEQISEAAVASLNSMVPSQSSSDTKADVEAIEATQPSNPTAIASIVDSVLAELKPRLMEEIAKKIANEKKPQ